MEMLSYVFFPLSPSLLSLSFLNGADIVFPCPSKTDLDSRLRVNRRFTYMAFES